MTQNEAVLVDLFQFRIKMFFRNTTALLFLCSLASFCVAKEEEVFVINKGIGGNASADGLKRFQTDVIDVKPDWLILYFGMNDAGNPKHLVEPEVFRKNMQAMINQARAAGLVNVILVTPNPVHQETLAQRVADHPAKSDLNGHLLKFDAVVRDLAVTNDLSMVDLRALCDEFGGGEDLKKSLIRVPANGGKGDGVHLTAAGYQKFAKLFIPVFKEKIKPGDVVVCFGDSITYGAHMPGGGTIYGDTYPAWLSVYLNQLAGVDNRTSPPIPIKIPGSPKNGDMEISSDRVRPDFWNVWNVAKRQEGDCRMAMGQGVSGNAVKVTNTNPEFPAVFISHDTPELEVDEKYHFSFQYQGSGQIRPVITFYTAKNKILGSFPTNDKANHWRQGLDEWKKDTIQLKAPEGAVKMRASFRVKGEILIDDVRFSIHRPEPGANRPEAAVKLANKHLAVQLRAVEAGGGIISISNRDDTEFINTFDDPSLWEVTLRHLPTTTFPLEHYAELSLDPEVNDGGSSTNKDDLGDGSETLILKAAEVDAQYKVEASPEGVKLTWAGIDVGNEKAVLDVFVELKLAENDRFLRVRSGIHNRSKNFTVYYLSAPRVSGIYPQDNNLAADRLAIPCFTGRLITNPVENGILGQSRRFQPNRSSHSMQFDAYYHKGKGLYLGCFDGEQNIKRYLYEKSSSGLLWSMVAVPDNMKQVPQNYTVPYDTVIRCFNGDWYDAARIYRQWALKQTWSAEGPLLIRKSIPLWFKEIDEWLLWGATQGKLYSVYDPSFFKPMQEAKLNIGVDLHKWGTHAFLEGERETPDRFPLPQKQIDFLKHSKEIGTRVFGYLQGVCWSTESDSFKKENAWKHAVRTYKNQTLAWPLGENNHPIIAYPGETWKNTLGKTVVEMAKAGFDGTYLDSNNHAGTYMNFNPLYNKQSGGGNEYIKANQKMMREMKKAARKHHPEFCFTSESFWEGNLAELDGIKAVNTWHRYLEAGVAEQIPLASAVYHDYAILFGVWVGKHSLQGDDGLDYVIKNGMALVQGFKPGWNQPANLLYFDNKELALKTSMQRYQAYAAARKFLLYGEMLRPPELLTPNEHIRFRWWRAWSKATYDADVSPVLSSLWKAADGSFGLVLYNVTPEAQAIKIKLTAKELRDVPNPKLQSIWPINTKANAAVEADNVIVTVSVRAQSPVILQIEAPVHSGEEIR